MCLPKLKAIGMVLVAREALVLAAADALATDALARVHFWWPLAAFLT